MEFDMIGTGRVKPLLLGLTSEVGIYTAVLTDEMTMRYGQICLGVCNCEVEACSCDKDDEIRVEITSNYYRHGDEKLLSMDEELRLVELGFTPGMQSLEGYKLGLANHCANFKMDNLSEAVDLLLNGMKTIGVDDFLHVKIWRR